MINSTYLIEEFERIKMNAKIKKKNQICRRVVDEIKLHARSMKILSEDRASITESENHSEKTALLSEIFNCRISLSISSHFDLEE